VRSVEGKGLKRYDQYRRGNQTPGIERRGTLDPIGSRRARYNDFYDLIPLDNSVSFSGSFAARFEHNQQFQFHLKFGATSINPLPASVLYRIVLSMNNGSRGAVVKLVWQVM
jgi:hypothetical protein